MFDELLPQRGTTALGQSYKGPFHSLFPCAASEVSQVLTARDRRARQSLCHSKMKNLLGASCQH